jgi:hypothetical protein
MARPNEVNSKTISVRIPMSQYIELLQTATNMKLSVSEYLLLKLFGGNQKQTISVKNETKKTPILLHSSREKYNLFKYMEENGIKCNLDWDTWIPKNNPKYEFESGGIKYMLSTVQGYTKIYGLYEI